MTEEEQPVIITDKRGWNRSDATPLKDMHDVAEAALADEPIALVGKAVEEDAAEALKQDEAEQAELPFWKQRAYLERLSALCYYAHERFKFYQCISNLQRQSTAQA